MIAPMSKAVRRGPAAIAPMPRQLDAAAHYSVRDQYGRTIRGGGLEPGTDLWQRLRDAHDAFARQGYSVSSLRNGQWAFSAVRGAQRLVVAIKAGIPASVASLSGDFPALSPTLTASTRHQ
jgi:hypothetical protein